MKKPGKLVVCSMVLAALALLATPASAVPGWCDDICTPLTPCSTFCAYHFSLTTCGNYGLCGFSSYSAIQGDSTLSLDLSQSEAFTEGAVKAGTLIEPSTGPTDAHREGVQPEVP